MGAHLNRANMGAVNIQGTNLEYAYFNDTWLDNPIISYETRLQNVNWGNYILAVETVEYFNWAIDVYRQLKTWHTNAGIYDIAAKFYYREMEARRKAQSWKRLHLKMWYWVMRMLCGYGEKPERVAISAAMVVLSLASIYFAIGTLTPNTFLNSLYYSAVSFTALGYGSWAPEPTGWVKGLGAFESFIGVFMMALFLVTFVRKMTR